jgi:hypothetical protein
MKKVLGLLIVVALIGGFAAIAGANDQAPIALTDAQMDQIVAGDFIPGHQRAAADLKGDVADFVKEHIIGELPEPGHQSAAADLKGDVADFVKVHLGLR